MKMLPKWEMWDILLKRNTVLQNLYRHENSTHIFLLIYCSLMNKNMITGLKFQEMKIFT